MDTAKELNIRITFSRRSVLLLITGFFVCWHPGFIGSETLQLTTYYPAPYGGYVGLLSTGGTSVNQINTLLARDYGRVGIGTGAIGPRSVLDVNGEISTAAKMTLSQDMQSTSQTWSLENNAGRFRVFEQPDINASGSETERLTILSGSGRVGINTDAPARTLDVNGDVHISGDLHLDGRIIDFCTRVAYDVGADAYCPAGKSVVGFLGDGAARAAGFLPSGPTTSSAGTYIVLGEDWGGIMVCCSI